MKIFLSFFILSPLLLSCDNDSEQKVFKAPVVVLGPNEQVLEVDSSVIDKPVFGDAGSVRQFPFGPLKVAPNDFRLMAVKRQGKPYLEFIYDTEGKLIESKGYFPDGKYLLSSSKYKYYPGAGIAEIEYWVNIQLKDMESPPTTSEIKLASTTKYANGPGTGVYDQVNQRAEDRGSYYSPENKELGFDQKGQQVWIATTSSGEAVMDYCVIKRDEAGNARQFRSRRRLDYSSGNLTTFTFDQKKNPYYTTGDAANLYAANPNNILTEDFSNNQGYKTPTKRNEYIYRPDGYPSQLLNPDTKEVIMEFIYNK